MQTASFLHLILLHILVYGATFWVFGGSLPALGIGGLLIWASVTDLTRFEIPDVASIGLLALGLFLAFQVDATIGITHAMAIWGSGLKMRKLTWAALASNVK
ncbi:MAG: hypothetical protein AAGG57_19990 [Pseudomonadota bacterium]